MIAVLYRWKVKAGAEMAFREAWNAMTETIRVRHGTGGSRLHRTDDGEFVAYAVWPSRPHWEAAAKLPSTSSSSVPRRSSSSRFGRSGPHAAARGARNASRSVDTTATLTTSRHSNGHLERRARAAHKADHPALVRVQQ